MKLNQGGTRKIPRELSHGRGERGEGSPM